jgi:hypothetical protein
LTKGPRLYDWAFTETTDPALPAGSQGANWLLIRRPARTVPGAKTEYAFYCAHAPSCLDMAEAALRLDLARCVPTKSGGLQVDDGIRLTLYLATGSSGIALVIQALLAHRPESEFAAARERIRTDLAAEFTLFPGLFEGRAGIMLASAALADDAPARQDAGGPTSSQADSHLRRLAWHALSYQGHAAFPGNGLHRLSMDLATGTAGVLLATCAATPGGATALPLLDAGCFAGRLPAGGAGWRKTEQKEEVTT